MAKGCGVGGLSFKASQLDTMSVLRKPNGFISAAGIFKAPSERIGEVPFHFGVRVLFRGEPTCFENVSAHRLW